MICLLMVSKLVHRMALGTPCHRCPVHDLPGLEWKVQERICSAHPYLPQLTGSMQQVCGKLLCDLRHCSVLL